MKKPMLYVDFNHMIEPNLVVLSKQDRVKDVNGDEVLLEEGMLITVYMEDLDENGNVDNLIATGAVERNSTTDWAIWAKWCCRIDSDGIRPQSEVHPR